MTKPTRILPIFALLLSTSACVDDEGNTSDTGAGSAESTAGTEGAADSGDTSDGGAVDDMSDGPSEENEQICKTICDRMLAFDCIVVDRHEDCFLACGMRSDDDIELFDACWSNTDFCSADPEPARQCLANFLDESTPDPTGDPDPTSCTDACNVYLGMGCEPPIESAGSCDEFCGGLSPELQAAAVSCLEGSVGCELPAGCQLPGGE